VKFNSTALPAYMSLDEDTGIIYITDPPAGGTTEDFWTEVPAHGTDTYADRYTITFNF
jgi:hypothetical protein